MKSARCKLAYVDMYITTQGGRTYEEAWQQVKRVFIMIYSQLSMQTAYNFLLLSKGWEGGRFKYFLPPLDPVLSQFTCVYSYEWMMNIN